MITAIRRLAATAPLPFLLMASLYAQQDRILARIDDTRRVVLRGNVSPLALPEFDRGAVDRSFNLRGMMLVLKQSAAQQSAMNQLLDEQRDQSSPKYHKWLTPQQYADQFGASPSDIAKITAWLKTESFTVRRSSERSKLDPIQWYGGAGEEVFSNGAASLRREWRSALLKRH